MKHCFFLAAALVLASALCACADKLTNEPATLPDNEIGGGGSVILPGAAAGNTETSEHPLGSAASDPNRIHLDGLPLYRGIVQSHDFKDGVHFLTLARAPGTDFTYPTINMETGENTLANFELADILPGDYVEAYFKDRPDGQLPLVAALNRLPPHEDSVFNGELIRHSPTGADSGTLELQKQSGHDVVVYEYDDRSLFYLDKSELNPGIKLSLFTEGVLISGDPPHGYVHEIRPFHEE